MKPILFEENERSYATNGIGVLHEALRCDVTEEHNGVFDMELEYPVSGEWANELRNQRQILAKPNDVDDDHAFRIYDVDKDLDNDVIIVKATSVTNDLGANLIVHAVAKDMTPQMALDEIKKNLIEPTIFDFVSDIQTRSSSEWTRINPLQAIAGTKGSLVDIWGGDIKRTNNTVYLYSRRGRDHVATIRPGKNIEGFNMTESTKGIVTKILPYYTYTPEDIPKYHMVEDYNGNMVKQQDYDNEPDIQPEPVTVTGNVVVSDEADKYTVKYYSPIDYSSDAYIQQKVREFIDAKKKEAEESTTIIDTSNFPEELKQFVIKTLNEEAVKYFTYTNPGVDKPSVSMRVDMVQLSDSSDWERYKDLERIQVTDTIDVYVKKFDVDVEIRIQSITYDSLGEKVKSIVAGSVKTSLTQSISKTYEDRTEELEEYISTLENGIYNDITRTANGQARRFSGYTEPPETISSTGDLWFKQIGAGEVETYIFKGGAWVPLITQTEMDKIDQEIINAKETAESANAKAQGVVDEINSVVTGNGFTTLEDLFASKVSDGEFGTMFFQESKAIGLFYDVNGVTESIIMINDGVPYIKGENIVLDGDTIVDGTFKVTDTMLASDAVIKRLIATGIDAKDVRIINLDASSITSGDLELTNGLRITNNGVPVMEVDANTGQVKITAPNLATKDDLDDFGGRNMMTDSYLQRMIMSNADRTFLDEEAMTNVMRLTFNNPAATYFATQQYSLDRVMKYEMGVEYTLSFKVRGNVTNLNYTYLMRVDGANKAFSPENVTMSETEWTTIIKRMVAPWTTVQGYILIGTTNVGDGKWFDIKEVKVERGSIVTDWTPNPQDVQLQLDSKAETDDLDSLAEIVSSVSSELNVKAGMGEFEALEAAFNARVEQDILDKEQLASDLATLEGRTALVEILAGDNKLVTQFIETVITESEEGIFIGNDSTKTGILLSVDRISFLDNETEVAYISNQTMKINHGIFVESATISDFKFEKIPGTTILAITWVGD